MSRTPDTRFVKRDPSRRVVRAFLPAQQAPTASGKTAPTWLLEPGIEGRRIAGTVVFEGEPIAGARVELRSEYFSLPGIKPPSATTDAEGRFDLGEQPPAVFAAMAEVEGFRPSRVRVNLRNPSSEPPPDSLVIELSKCEAWAFGLVHDVYGGLVTQGAVSVASRIGEAWHQELVSVPLGDDGSFSLCRPRDHQLIFVTASGYGTAWLRDPMPPSGYDVRLFPGAAIKGKVVDDAGAPIAGARVVLMGSFSNAGGLQAPPAQTAMSQADGSFRFEDIAPTEYEVMADHGGHGMDSTPPSVSLQPGQEVTGIVVTMSSCRTLAGTVLMDGEPVVGASVGPYYRAITQDDGSFYIGCTSSEEIEFKVERYDVLDPMVPAGDNNIDDLIVEVARRSSISGRVTADGAAVEGAVVAIGNPSGGVGIRSVFGESHRATTDAEGRWELNGVPAGSYEINGWDPASKRRSKPTTVTVAKQSSTNGIEIELANAGAIAGTVTDPDGNPVPNIDVHVFGGQVPAAGPGQLSSFHDDAFSTKTSESGTFRIGGLSPSSYSVCLGWCYHREPDPRYLPQDGESWPDIEVRNTDKDTEVRLVIRSRTGLSISGRVVYHDQNPGAFRRGPHDAPRRHRNY